jgi:TolB protein
MTLWAPDGSAFAYAGTNEAGETGVWIQPAVEGVDPVLLGAGVFASWSPA